MEELPEFQWTAKAGKREAILASAFEIFHEKGFNQAKIEDIARHAGVGKGTVYLYFSSKEHLLREMLKEVVHSYLMVLRRHVAADASPRERLHGLFRTHAAIVRRYHKLKMLSQRDFDFIDEELRNWLMQQRAVFVDELQALVEDGIRAGQFRPVDTRLAALMLDALLGALVFEEAAFTKRGMEPFLDIIERGLVAEQDRASDQRPPMEE